MASTSEHGDASASASATASDHAALALASWGQDSPGPLLSTLVAPQKVRLARIVVPAFVVVLLAAGTFLALARGRTPVTTSPASTSRAVAASASAAPIASTSAAPPSSSGAPPASATARTTDVSSLPAAPPASASAKPAPQSTGKVTPPPGRRSASPPPASTKPASDTAPDAPADLPLPTFTASPKVDPPPPPALPE